MLDGRCRTSAPAILVVMMLGCMPASSQSLFVSAPGSPIRAGKAPHDLAAADIDGDGHLDLATATLEGNGFTILLGDGAGRFRIPEKFQSPSVTRPHLIAAGDLNGDGRADIALTSHDSNDVFLFLSGEGLRFRPAPGAPVPALESDDPHNHGLLLADVNRDGNLDILTSNQNDDSVSVLLGNGDGAFTPASGSPFRVGRSPYPLGAGDADGDGHADIVVPNFRGASVTLLLGDGAGGFAEAPDSPFPVSRGPYFAGLGDADGDGNPDIVISHSDSARISILTGDGEGGFGEARRGTFAFAERGWKVRLGDVNGDGHVDLVTSGMGERVSVLLGDGEGRFRPAEESSPRVGTGLWGIVLADFNGDGALDVATTSSGNNTVSVLLGQP